MSFNVNTIKKGPSVDSARIKSVDGKVKVQDILSFGKNAQQMSVEEARDAMIAAGEAPAGDPREAKGGSSSDSQTRWQRAARPVSRPTPVATREQKETSIVQPVVEHASGYLIRFTYSDGKVETIEAANRVHMIQEVKRRQAWLMAKNLKADVEILELGEENAEAVKTEIGAGVEIQKTSADGTLVPAEVAQRGQGGSTTVKEPTVERLENSKFTLEIFQEDGEWTGRITYKNGSGTESFSAASRKDLMMKVLEGKAHATLKVREVLRRDQFHDDLDKVYDIPGYTQDAFDALSPEAQTLVIDTLGMREAELFKMDVPEFYGTAENTKRILGFLNKRNLPVTRKNLKYAFEELVDDLDHRPQPNISLTETSAPVVATVAADSAPTTAAPPVVASAIPATAAAPTTEVRKRGSFGFKPGFASADNTELEETRSGKKTTEPSEKDARNMPLEELAKQVRKGYNRRQF